MKIGLVLPKLTTGGAEQVVMELGREYQRLGHTVEVIALSRGGTMEARFAAAGLPATQFDLARTFRPGLSWAAAVRDARATLREHLRRSGPEVVHTHLLGPDVDGVVAARRAGIPVVVHTIHNVYGQFAETSLRRRVQNVRRRCLWRGYDRLYGVDGEVRAWAVRCRMAAPARVGVVVNGIDFSRLEVPEGRAELRRELGWREGEVVLLNVGSLTDQKNQEALIRAVGSLRRADRRVRLAIAGAGPLEPALSRRIEQEELTGSAQLLGVRSDVPRLLAAADVFAFPSLWEGLPIALLEALAAGLPVVASDIPVHRRLLDGGRLGLLAPVTPEGIARALGEAMDDLPAARTGAAAARDEVRLRYSAQRMAGEYLAEYERLLGMRSRGTASKDRGRS